jgi:hypothetical protein
VPDVFTATLLILTEVALVVCHVSVAVFELRGRFAVNCAVGLGWVVEHDSVAVRVCVSAGQAAPPLAGGVTMLRTHVSVRDRWPLVHAPHAPADCSVHALTTQFTGAPVTGVEISFEAGPS